MEVLYSMIKQLIAQSRTEGLAEKVDVFYVHNRLTREEYDELMTALGEE